MNPYRKLARERAHQEGLAPERLFDEVMRRIERLHENPVDALENAVICLKHQLNDAEISCMRKFYKPCYIH